MWDSSREDSLDNLLTWLVARGRIHAALRLARAAWQSSRDVLGEDHVDTAFYAERVGLLLLAKGETAEAESMIRKTLSAKELQLGAENPHTLVSKHNLAFVLAARNELAAARALMSEVLRGREAELGERHPDTLAASYHLAWLMHQTGDAAGSAERYAETLRTLRDLWGPAVPDVCRLVDALIEVHVSESRWPSAERVARKQLEVVLAEVSPNSSRATAIAQAHETLGTLLGRMGRHEDALPFHREALEVHRRALPEDHPDVADSLAGLGAVLLDLQKYVEAEPLLRECLAIRKEKLPDHWLRFNALSLLGGALARQGKFEEAEPLLLGGYARMRDDPAANNDRRREALERIVELYDARHEAQPAEGYDAKTAEWRATLEVWRASTQPAGRAEP